MVRSMKEYEGVIWWLNDRLGRFSGFATSAIFTARKIYINLGVCVMKSKVPYIVN